MPDLSIIIVNWNTRDLLPDCLDSILNSKPRVDCDIILVDNHSTDGSQTMVRERYPQVQLIENGENVGFARANNLGVRACSAPFVLLLNSDARLAPDALEVLITWIKSQPQAGLVGGCLLNPDGSFQASYTSFPGLWQEFLILSGLGRLLFGRWYPSRGPGEGRPPRKVDYVEGACMLVRKDAYQVVGGLDETYFMYAEDVELCHAMRTHGWQVWYHPDARIVHLGGGSSRHRKPQREADLYRSRIQFFEKHYGKFAASSLRLLILVMTGIKIAVHGVLRWASRGRYGRQVVSWADLLRL